MGGLDHLLDAIKWLAPLATAFWGLYKEFKGTRRLPARHLLDRRDRLKQFYADGGTDQPPLMLEASFGAAIGHGRLNAHEIRLVLRQTNPTRFMSSYLELRSHLRVQDDATAVELQGFAARPRRRKAAIAIGIFGYFVFGLSGAALLLAALPRTAAGADWQNFVLILMLGPLSVALAVMVLAEAGKLHRAHLLCKLQKTTG